MRQRREHTAAVVACADSEGRYDPVRCNDSTTYAEESKSRSTC